ncbi:MAG: bifunctional demethylmenaquinone methyltransferase/2-methoxy-6-polyprenyl-1,4-benzoquinol methylase UbiE [Desulfobacterales bacterium]
MVSSKNFWGSEQDRQYHLDERIRREKMANYGYRKVPEDEKTTWVLRHFNSVARQYDFMNTLLSFGIHYLWKRTAVAMLGLKAGERVLDVCGGTGDLAILAKRAVGACGTVAVYDINRAMIEAGRSKKTNAPIRGQICYVQGNAEHLAFPDGHFDAVTVGFGIRNVTHMEQGFREMLRVLKPGGRMMCLEFSKPSHPLFRRLYDFYSFYIMPLSGQLLAGSRQAYTHLPESIRLFPLPEELQAILERIGYVQVSWRRLTNGIAVVHTGRKPHP